MLVERNIDGMWFPAEVLRTDSASGMVSLKYIDDGNIEDMVPSCEVRIPLRDSHSSSPRVDKKVTLPKPLLGLMEDDCAERYNHLPKTIVHANDDDDDSGISAPVP